jgi:hypothetical protein
MSDTINYADLPKVFVFKTRLGNTGLLQVANFTGNATGVEFSYKLVQQNASTPIAQAYDKVARLQLQIADNELEIARDKFKSEVLSQAAGDLSASNIVALMQGAYATIYTYRDSGWTVAQNGRFVSTNRFDEVLNRRNYYRIKVVTDPHSFSQTNQWWSDGTTEFSQSGDSIAFKDSHPASESSQLSFVNQNSTVPALFYNLGWGNILTTMMYSSPTELVRLKDETANGVDCYVLQRVNIGLTVWVGKRDFLIRRYRNFLSMARMNEARLHSPKGIRLPPAAQSDITFIENHEKVVVNENLKPAYFIPPLETAK